MVRDTGDGSGHFLNRKEGVTQGDPLSTIAYDIGVPPPIRELQGEHPRVTQPWYADDAGAGGGVIYTHIGAPTVLAGEGPAKALLPGVYQEYHDRGPDECIQGIGFLMWDRNTGCDGESVPKGVHQRWIGGEDLAGWKS